MKKFYNLEASFYMRFSRALTFSLQKRPQLFFFQYTAERNVYVFLFVFFFFFLFFLFFLFVCLFVFSVDPLMS